MLDQMKHRSVVAKSEIVQRSDEAQVGGGQLVAEGAQRLVHLPDALVEESVRPDASHEPARSCCVKP